MSGNDDLLPEQTAGFKVGEKKTLDEYNKLGTSNILLIQTLLSSYLQSTIVLKSMNMFILNCNQPCSADSGSWAAFGMDPTHIISI